MVCGLSWGLIGLIDLNVVESALGAGSIIRRTIHAIVGPAALSLIRAGFTKRLVETVRPVV